jgi:hypothetical protein
VQGAALKPHKNRGRSGEQPFTLDRREYFVDGITDFFHSGSSSYLSRIKA